MIYSHAMSVMFCCYDLKRNKQLPCQKASNSLEQTVPQEVCLSPSSYRHLLLLPSGFLLRYLLPFLYIGL